MIITLAAITLAAANPFPEPAGDVGAALTSVGLQPLLAVDGFDEKGAVELPWDLAQGSVHGESLEKVHRFQNEPCRLPLQGQS